jgi:hypothetical protein
MVIQSFLREIVVDHDVDQRRPQIAQSVPRRTAQHMFFKLRIGVAARKNGADNPA